MIGKKGNDSFFYYIRVCHGMAHLLSLIVVIMTPCFKNVFDTCSVLETM